MDEVTRDDWLVAQEVERKGWQQQDWMDMGRERRTSEWDRHLRDLGTSLDAFAGLDVLDVGCGPTSVAYFIDGKRRVGLDPLADTYAEWNGYFGEPIELVHSMAETMPFDDGEFDAVFCVNCIDHTLAPEEILEECARVVRPGGTLIFHVDLDSPLRKLHKLVKTDCGLAHPQSLTYRWVRERIDRNFTVVAEARDPEVFRATRSQMRYEAYWDGLLYKITKGDMWRNHTWMRAQRNA